MRLFSRILLVLPLLFILTSSLYAEETPDTRLQKKVTLELGLVNLHDLMTQISKQTGIVIYTGTGPSDWRVKERKTIIYAKDIPAGEILSRVAKLHHYHISRSGEEDKWLYRIWQDKKEKDEEAALRDQELRDYEGKPARLADYYSNLAGTGEKMTPEELSKLKESDPFKYFCLKDPLGKAMCDLYTAIPKETWQGRQQWDIPLSQNPKLRAAVERTFNEMLAIARIAEPDIARRGPAQFVLNDSASITFRSLNASEISNDMFDSGFAGMINVSGVQGSENAHYGAEDLPMFDPTSKASEMIAGMINQLRSGMDPHLIEQQMMAGYMNGMMSIDGISKDDPLLKEKIKLDPGDLPTYAAVMKAIYEKTSKNIISDSYREPPVPFRGETEISKVLQALTMAYHKRFAVNDPWFTADSTNWYKARMADISQAYLDALKKKAEEKGMGVPDLAKAAADLTDEQIKGNIGDDGTISRVLLAIRSNTNAFRFYGRLTPGERNALSTTGLPVESLQPEVADLLVGPFRLDSSSYPLPSGSKIRLEAQETDPATHLVSNLNMVLQIAKPDGKTDEHSITISGHIPPKSAMKPNPTEKPSETNKQ